MFVRLIQQFIYDLFINIEQCVVILEFRVFLDNYSVLFYDDFVVLIEEVIKVVEFMLRLFYVLIVLKFFKNIN